MRCKMKAMIVDMCILSHKTQCFWDVRTSGGRRRGQKEGFARNYTVSIYRCLCFKWTFQSDEIIAGKRAHNCTHIPNVPFGSNISFSMSRELMFWACT